MRVLFHGSTWLLRMRRLLVVFCCASISFPIPRNPHNLTSCAGGLDAPAGGLGPTTRTPSESPDLREWQMQETRPAPPPSPQSLQISLPPRFPLLRVQNFTGLHPLLTPGLRTSQYNGLDREYYVRKCAIVTKRPGDLLLRRSRRKISLPGCLSRPCLVVLRKPPASERLAVNLQLSCTRFEAIVTDNSWATRNSPPGDRCPTGLNYAVCTVDPEKQGRDRHTFCSIASHITVSFCPERRPCRSQPF